MDFDPVDLDGWDAAPDVCPAVIVVQVDGVALSLACETGGEHDEHEATLRWPAEKLIYAHDAHCNSPHEAGPDECPPPRPA